jgi:protein phosphatase
MSFVRRLLGRNDEPTGGADANPKPPTEQQVGETEEKAEEQANVSDVTDADPPPEAADQAPAPVSTAGSERPTTPHPPGLRVGFATDVGIMRDHNEDTLLILQSAHLGDEALDPFGFFIVADGMGGHRAGEVASSLAARLVNHHVLDRVYLPFLINRTPGEGMAPLTDILRDAVQAANERVHEEVPGAGTTLTCALVLGRRALIAHVGDSRAYMFANGEMKQVTEDHSYVSRLMELGELSPEEAAVHPQRHVLYRAIGQGENLDVDTYHQSLSPGSRLLLCSDGLSGSVSEDIIRETIASAGSPQEVCEELIKSANDAGGADNISAILIETPPEE